MRTSIAKLAKNVQQLLEAHRLLLAFCGEHKDSLIKGEVAEIETTVAKIESVSKRIHELEAERVTIAQEVAGELGVSADEITLSALEPMLSEAEREHFSTAAKELQELMAQLAQVNVQNRGLLEQSMSYLTKTVQLVASALEQDVYGPGASRRQGGHLFNVQA